jgi:tripartite-type tricarboxylate transporter receptor subunit TctC
MNGRQTRCAPSPRLQPNSGSPEFGHYNSAEVGYIRLRREGWGEGGFRYARCLVSPPHPALRADLFPQAGRGGVRGASAIISRATKILARESLVILALLALANPSLAQDYPTRPIRALTTTSAGGISDVFMRALGDELLKRWGQAIVVENRPGGMQNVGARACSEAPPDGYTICILNAEPIAYNQFLLKNMPFDPEKGVQPVTNLYHLIQTLVVNSQLNVKTIDELIALSKAKAGTLNYVTASVPLALYMETLKKEQGADWVRVPFKGGGEAVNAVLTGSTPIALIGEGNVIGQIRAGAMTPLVMLNTIKSPNFRPYRPWPRPVTPARPRAAGMASSRRPAPRSRSSTSSPRKSPPSSMTRASASGISAPAAWCRRSTHRNNSQPRSGRIARWRKRWSRPPASSRSEGAPQSLVFGSVCLRAAASGLPNASRDLSILQFV